MLILKIRFIPMPAFKNNVPYLSQLAYKINKNFNVNNTI